QVSSWTRGDFSGTAFGAGLGLELPDKRWEHVWNLLQAGKLPTCRHPSVMWEHVWNLLQVGKLPTCRHHSVRRLLPSPLSGGSAICRSTDSCQDATLLQQAVDEV